MISEFPDIGDSDIGVGYCDIRKSPISGTVISGKTPISELARIQMVLHAKNLKFYPSLAFH